MAELDTAVSAAAQRLRAARQEGTPCLPVRDILGSGDVEAAYAVQTLNNEKVIKQGGRPNGWKIGLTSEVVQRQLGVGQPDFGMLFADCECGDDLMVPMEALLQPRVEAEVAFVLSDDLPNQPVGVADVVRATDFVLPAIEIVDSRVAGWDISIVDTVADNASSGLYVLGPCPVRLIGLDLREVGMEMTGPDGAVVSSGAGAACLGHPVNAVVWLANTLAGLGSPLRAGDLVLSGALGPMVGVAPGAC